jgi:hypothetical protein
MQKFGTGHPEKELQMVQFSATRCSCIAILGVSLVSFATITFCIASQLVFIVVSVHFIIINRYNNIFDVAILPYSK